MSGEGPFRAATPPRRLERPPRGEVLVVAPHPDDETMGLGGTLAHHAAQGDRIAALFVCNGIQGDPEGFHRREELVEIRRREARDAAAVLGIGQLFFWDHPDNLSDADIHVFEGLPADPDRAREALADGFAARLGGLLDQMLAAEEVDVVYAPWAGELNADHWLIGQGILRLRRSRPDLEERLSWLGYDVWTACPPDLVIDTSDVIGTKLEAVRCYPSQEIYVDYAHPVLGLDAYRSLFLEAGATYGEAFVGHYKEPRA